MREIHKNNKHFFPLFFCVQIFAICEHFLKVYTPKFIIDNIEIEEVSIAIFASMYILCIEALMKYATNLINQKLSVMSERQSQLVSLSLLKKFMNTDYENTEQQKFNNMLEHLKYKASGNFLSTLRSTEVFIQSIIEILLYSTVLINLSPWILLLLILSNIISLAINKTQINFERNHREEVASYNRKTDFFSSLSLQFQYIKEIKIQGIAHKFIEKSDDVIEKKYKLSKKKSMIVFICNGIDALLTLLREGCTYFVLIILLFNEKLGTGDFVFYFGVVATLSGLLRGIASSFSNLLEDCEGITYLKDFLAYPDKMIHTSDAKVESNNKAYDIELRNITYQYQGSDDVTLKNINLHIRSGEKLAVVGANGAGKTTLIKLICGMYTPTSGEILINGKALSEYSVNDYYMHIATVFQDIHLLPITIAEFVSASTDDLIDYEMVNNCLKRAGLYEKICTLKDGTKTKLVKGAWQDAVDLSGGEQQKLMLARALYKKANLMILDEPTAALDPIAESQIYEQYNEMTKNITSIFVSHRLASTKFCDRIILIDNGEILEEGTHNQLLQKKGTYTLMYETQSQYYRDNTEKTSDKTEGT